MEGFLVVVINCQLPDCFSAEISAGDVCVWSGCYHFDSLVCGRSSFRKTLFDLFVHGIRHYVLKVLSTSFRSQVVVLFSFCPPFASVEHERLHLLCPVCSMWTALVNGANPQNCWCVMVLAAEGALH